MFRRDFKLKYCFDKSEIEWDGPDNECKLEGKSPENAITSTDYIVFQSTVFQVNKFIYINRDE